LGGHPPTVPAKRFDYYRYDELPQKEPELNQLPNTQVARLDVQNRSSIAEAIDEG
jgi:hypothetical protein